MIVLFIFIGIFLFESIKEAAWHFACSPKLASSHSIYTLLLLAAAIIGYIVVPQYGETIQTFNDDIVPKRLFVPFVSLLIEYVFSIFLILKGISMYNKWIDKVESEYHYRKSSGETQ